MKAHLLLACVSSSALTLVPVRAPVREDRAPELGRVRFGRDLDEGSKQARTTQKPVFLLFQEIPGCATCRAFGGGPLTHPLLVEAIETAFVPVVVHNNLGARDREVLERFHEPAWNNPIVRFLDADGHDLIAREEGVWSSEAVAQRMIRALERTPNPVPPWLRLAHQELATRDAEHVVFAMHCFWEGQAALGAIAGVVDARPGFVEGAEVVDVRFDPSVISYGDLVRKADGLDCALKVWCANDARVAEARSIVAARAARLEGSVRAAGAADDLRHLQSVPALNLVPLTRAQALRVNSALKNGKTAFESVLSPRQIEIWHAIERKQSKPSTALDGLKRPDDVDTLGKYACELEERLARP